MSNLNDPNLNSNSFIVPEADGMIIGRETGSTSSLADVSAKIITQKNLNKRGEYLGSSSPDLIEVDTFLPPNPFIIYGLQENDTLSGGAGDDSLFGGKGEDSLRSLNGNDIIQGNLDNDWIDGGNGNDSLFGGQGNDTLLGAAGNDFLAGDKGVDELTGGFGADQFVLRTPAEEETGLIADVITDFAPGEDLIVINGVPSFAQLSITPITPQAVQGLFPTINRTLNGGTLIEVRSTGKILGFLENINPDQLSVANFQFFP